ncbi:MAG: hypothetical protein FJ315_00080 [SAR202 cluster bacterium]|nr:hypothetical protein [SAR202 cluster bacterium]
MGGFVSLLTRGAGMKISWPGVIVGLVAVVWGIIMLGTSVGYGLWILIVGAFTAIVSLALCGATRDW